MRYFARSLAASDRRRACRLRVAGPGPAVGRARSIRSGRSSPLTAAEERALKPGDGFKECSECPEMVVVPAGCLHDGIAGGREGPRGERRPAASGDDRAAVRGGQVRGDVRRVGRLRGRTRLHAQATRRRRPARPAGAAESGRSSGVSWDDVTRRVPAVAVGARPARPTACSPRRSGSTRRAQGRRRPTPSATRSTSARLGTPKAGDSVGMTAEVGSFRGERLRPPRHARQRLGVGAGLLEPQLRRCTFGRLRAALLALLACAPLASPVAAPLRPSSDVQSLGRPLRQTASGAPPTSRWIDLGFRVARTL